MAQRVVKGEDLTNALHQVSDRIRAGAQDSLTQMVAGTDLEEICGLFRTATANFYMSLAEHSFRDRENPFSDFNGLQGAYNDLSEISDAFARAASEKQLPQFDIKQIGQIAFIVKRRAISSAREVGFDLKG